MRRSTWSCMTRPSSSTWTQVGGRRLGGGASAYCVGWIRVKSWLVCCSGQGWDPCASLTTSPSVSTEPRRKVPPAGRRIPRVPLNHQRPLINQPISCFDVSSSLQAHWIDIGSIAVHQCVHSLLLLFVGQQMECLFVQNEDK